MKHASLPIWHAQNWKIMGKSFSHFIQFQWWWLGALAKAYCFDVSFLFSSLHWKTNSKWLWFCTPWIMQKWITSLKIANNFRWRAYSSTKRSSLRQQSTFRANHTRETIIFPTNYPERWRVWARNGEEEWNKTIWQTTESNTWTSAFNSEWLLCNCFAWRKMFVCNCLLLTGNSIWKTAKNWVQTKFC